MAKNTTYKGYTKLAERIARNTHFTCEEVDALLHMYEVAGGGARWDGNKFRDAMHGLLGLTEETLMEGVYQVFDTDQDGSVGPEEFVVCMSVFLRGNLDELIEYCFSVYDHNGDGHVSKDEMAQLLKAAVVNVPPGEEQDEVLKDLVEVLLKRMDLNHDGKLNFEEYRTAVLAEPLLLEVLGPCLPEAQARERFLSTFLDTYGNKAQI
ncbi:calaxin-like [Oratosquilla oratoria]|uniref:calaxin-like n=1 Tax=Oratosquilla oratoria TaxID=337810 RepID=UPI003F77488C